MQSHFMFSQHRRVSPHVSPGPLFACLLPRCASGTVVNSKSYFSSKALPISFAPRQHRSGQSEPGLRVWRTTSSTRAMHAQLQARPDRRVLDFFCTTPARSLRQTSITVSRYSAQSRLFARNTNHNPSQETALLSMFGVFESGPVTKPRGRTLSMITRRMFAKPC